MLEFVDVFFALVVAGYESSDRMSESLFHTLFVSQHAMAAFQWFLSTTFNQRYSFLSAQIRNYDEPFI